MVRIGKANEFMVANYIYLQAAGKLFGNKETPFFFLAMSKESEDYEKVMEAVRTVAKANAGKIVAVYLNTDDKAAGQVLNYLDLKDGDYPTYRLLNLEKVRQRSRALT